MNKIEEKECIVKKSQKILYLADIIREAYGNDIEKMNKFARKFIILGGESSEVDRVDVAKVLIPIMMKEAGNNEELLNLVKDIFAS